jgi:hypothetical protein
MKCHNSRCSANRISILMAMMGLLLIIVGQLFLEFSYKGLEIGAIATSIGVFISTIMFMQFLYDHYIREKYFSEISETIIKSNNIRESGIVDFFSDSKDVRYHDLIAQSGEIEIYLHTSSRLVKDYMQEWEERSRRNKKATFCFVNPEGKAAKYLDASGYSLDNSKASLEETKRLINEVDVNGIFEVTEHDHILKYNVFRFDYLYYIVINTNFEAKARVPALIVKLNTPLGEFIDRDLRKLKGE